MPLEVITAASDEPLADILWVWGFEWRGYTDPAHQCIVRDYRGKDIVCIGGGCWPDPVSIVYGGPVPINKLTVAQLDSGQLLINCHL